MRRPLRILATALAVTIALTTSTLLAATPAQTRGPKQKPQALILEFGQDAQSATQPATKSASASSATSPAARATAATKPTPVPKPRGSLFGKPTTARSAAAKTSDSGVKVVAAEEPAKPKPAISMTTAMLVVIFAAVAGVMIAILRKRGESAA